MHTAGQKMTNKKNKIDTYIGMCRELLGSLFFPARCLVCNEILEPEIAKSGIHPACKNKLYPILGAVCMHCGRPIGNYNSGKRETKYEITYEPADEVAYETAKEYCRDCIIKGYNRNSAIKQAKSLYIYKGAIKKSMYRFKYSNQREYADFFAREAMKKYGAWMKQAGIEVIVPVPMYLPKQRRRGYNQAECFANRLSACVDIPVNTKIVRRILDTRPQKELDDKQRKENLKKAFQSAGNVVQYKCVLVVDDIYTTGSTAEAVARELIKEGAHRVYVMTVCIGGDV